MEGRRAVQWLAAVLLLAVLLLAAAVWSLPRLSDDELDRLVFPKSWHDVQSLRMLLDHYAQSHLPAVLATFFLLYIFLQCFSIPGTTFLNVLAGALFGLKLSFAVCVLMAQAGTMGASLAYMLSMLFGRALALYLCPERLRDLEAQVSAHKAHLFSYLLFLRITPFLPNWFINLASPVVSIPLVTFASATFLGIMPQTFLTVEAGQALGELTDEDGSGIISLQTWAMLAAFGCLALLPPLLSHPRFAALWGVREMLPEKKQS